MQSRVSSCFRFGFVFVTLLAAGVWTSAVAWASPESEALAKQMLDDAGVTGGLVVQYGCGDGHLTAALYGGDGFLVQALDTEPANVAKAREYVRSLGLYGRVSVQLCEGERLPYADNLVNLFVAEELGDLPMEEVFRVLAPGGVACIQRDGAWGRAVKARPDSIDQWTHSLYDAGNNAVAKDTEVEPPHHLQWTAGPRNTRHHETLASISVVVSAGGRLFYIIDDAQAASILVEPEWALVARDAFNGVALWRRPIASWASHLTGFRSGPVQLARRLVAVGERVYVTLGIDAPVTCLDGATGTTLMTYAGTESTEELLFHDGKLFLVVGGAATEDKAADEAAPGKAILAMDAETGETLWRTEEVPLRPSTLAVSDEGVFYLDAHGVVRLDAETGAEVWRTGREVAQERPGWSSATLVVHDGVVLCADRQPEPAPDFDEYAQRRMPKWLADGGAPGELTAYACEDGAMLWSAACAEGFHSPIDVFVIGDVVWSGLSRARQGPDFTVARDLRTGDVRLDVTPDKAFDTTMPHHRCHRNRATSRYLVTGRTGVEFIDVQTGEALRHHWVRGVCQYGVLPCNGLLYAPPHSCACYIEAKLTGFLALSGRRPVPSKEEGASGPAANQRLWLGPAYKMVFDAGSENAGHDDWPTHRHDPSRSGHTNASVPVRLGMAWERKLGGRLSSPVVAEDVMLIASTDTHTVHALDARNGRTKWTFTAGACIDSPPTIAKGRALFGSADGWVYCLRLSDGALVWRFRAAPEVRHIVAFGQVESTWPVHGSVLVEGNAVYCAAGRTSYLDDGIHLYRLALATGEVLAERRLYSRDEETGEQPEEPIMFEMPGALPDVLSSDGRLVYMRGLCFDPDTLEPQEPTTHLYSPGGLLNDTWWHRNYWIYGHHFYSGYIGWYFAGHETPAGRMLALDTESIYGFGYRPQYYRGALKRKYHLFATGRPAPDAQPSPDYRRANRDYPPKGDGKFNVPSRWTKDVPLIARALVSAGDTLLVAGPPEHALYAPEALRGADGSLLCAVAAADGEVLSRYVLESAPVFDGMAAANGRLYVSMLDGRVLCLAGTEAVAEGETRTALKEAPEQRSVEPGLVGHWRLDAGKGKLAMDASGLNNTATVKGRWVNGPFGTCLSSEGVPGALLIDDDASLQFDTSGFSLSFWVKLDAYDCRILGKEDYPRNWWVINVLPDGRTELVIGESNTGGKSARAKSETPLSMETWTHLVYVVDRSASQVTCYINGALDSQTPIPATLTGSLSVAGQDLQVPSSHKPFRGLFDEFKAYARTLHEAEVKADYTLEKRNRASAEFRAVP